MKEVSKSLSPPKMKTIPSTGRSLPIALLRARESVMAPIRDMLAQSGISEQKWRVLRVLDERGPMEQTAIAEAASLLLPSLTRIVQSMQAEGLVSRRSDADDRRKSVVTITASGQNLLYSHADETNAIHARLELEFGAERLEALLDMLDELRKISL